MDHSSLLELMKKVISGAATSAASVADGRAERDELPDGMPLIMARIESHHKSRVKRCSILTSKKQDYQYRVANTQRSHWAPTCALWCAGRQATQTGEVSMLWLLSGYDHLV